MQTAAILQAGSYICPSDGLMVRLPDRRREHDATQMYPERLSQAHVRETVRCGFDPTLGEVWNCDTVEAARHNHTHTRPL